MVPRHEARKALSYFVAVAHHRSIREAANFLHLTSSALNRHILDLEEELSAPLFERHARGVRLSAAGETYLAYAKKPCATLRMLIQALESLKGSSAVTSKSLPWRRLQMFI